MKRVFSQLRVWKGRGLALSPFYDQRTDPDRSRPPKTRPASRTTHCSKSAKGRARVSSNPRQRRGYPPCTPSKERGIVLCYVATRRISSSWYGPRPSCFFRVPRHEGPL